MVRSEMGRQYISKKKDGSLGQSVEDQNKRKMQNVNIQNMFLLQKQDV